MGPSTARRVALVVALGFGPVATAEPPHRDWLAPLASTEPDAAVPGADLEALGAWLGDAQVVGLGESIHGVHEFRRLAHRIFAHLVETRGFDVFALEISQAHAARLNEFVQGGPADLDALLAERWWPAAIFYDQALRELLVWMRRHNETATRPVHFAGFDFKQPSFAVAAVLDGLAAVDPAAAGQARGLYAVVRDLEGLGVYPNVYGYSGGLALALPPRQGPATLRVRVRVRGRQVSHGWVGLSIHEGNPAATPPRASRYLQPADLGGGDTTIDLEMEIGASVREPWIELFHRGNGTVWFDRLRVSLDGREVQLEEGLAEIQGRPLQMPGIQAMDHRATLQPDGAAGPTLRVACDPTVDAALQAARDAEALVARVLAAADPPLPGAVATWLRQMSRLVVQAVEYRALVETNRDVYLAENLAWIQRRGMPGSRVLALAHSSHTNRRARGDGGMGHWLATTLGERYRTVSLLALAGQYRDFGDPGDLTPGSRPRVQAIDSEMPGPLALRLAELATGDLLARLATADGAPEEVVADLPAGALADVAVLLRRVGPSLPADEP